MIWAGLNLDGFIIPIQSRMRQIIGFGLGPSLFNKLIITCKERRTRELVENSGPIPTACKLPHNANFFKN